MMLIGIAGAARAGKDTLATAIKYVLPNTKSMSFAWAVKEEADKRCLYEHGISAFTENPEEKKVIRDILIAVGHGGRQTDPNVWVNKLSNKIDATLPTSHVVITDVRYKNESEMIRSKGGIVIFLHRNAQENIPTEQDSLPLVTWDIMIDLGNTNVIPILKTLFKGIIV